VVKIEMLGEFAAIEMAPDAGTIVNNVAQTLEDVYSFRTKLAVFVISNHNCPITGEAGGTIPECDEYSADIARFRFAARLVPESVWATIRLNADCDTTKLP
jgi:hypothetical protein